MHQCPTTIGQTDPVGCHLRRWLVRGKPNLYEQSIGSLKRMLNQLPANVRRLGIRLPNGRDDLDQDFIAVQALL